MNKKLCGVQEVHSTVGKTQTDKRGRNTTPGQHFFPREGFLEVVMSGHGEGSGGNSRGPFADTGRAHGPLLDPAQTLLAEGPLALGGHAVHVEVVQQQRLRVLAQGVGLDHTPCEHAWVLGAEEKLDPGHPVLAGQEGWPSWGQWEREGNTRWSSLGWSSRLQAG